MLIELQAVGHLSARKRGLMEAGRVAAPRRGDAANRRRGEDSPIPESARAFVSSSREETRRTNDQERGDSR